MKIIKKIYNLSVGTIIYRNTGVIIIVSEYDSFHNWYEYKNVDFNDDGDMIEIYTGGYVTPYDLIGDEY